MINFTEGNIHLTDKFISINSDFKYLETLAKTGEIEKRKIRNESDPYYYIEVNDGLRFGVFVSMKRKKIEWLQLRWLDRPTRGWEDVNEKKLQDEYCFLLRFVEEKIGRPHDSKKNWRKIWFCEWGEVHVNYDPRSFDVRIFMKPKQP